MVKQKPKHIRIKCVSTLSTRLLAEVLFRAGVVTYDRKKDTMTLYKPMGYDRACWLDAVPRHLASFGVETEVVE